MSEDSQLEKRDQILQRKEKLAKLREQGQAYPNGIRPKHSIVDILTKYKNVSKEDLKTENLHTRLCGRIMTRRLMGKASFVHIQDMSGRFQLYIRAQDLPEGLYAGFQDWDIGDIIWADGVVFRTKTEELSLHCDNIGLLAKSLHPLPDKFHGLVDTELCYRQRYLDLIMNAESRQRFKMRSELLSVMRDFMHSHAYMEVETPMMQSLAGGAAARPFATHHHTLDLPLFLRVAPELYLKRLIVGGFERVYEINRNFRNEGISTRHNPEFTMIEFYQAYATYTDMMDFTELMLRYLADKLLSKKVFNYQGHEIDFASPFVRMTLPEAILAHNPEFSQRDLDDIDSLRKILHTLGLPEDADAGIGKLQLDIFDKTVEKKLIAPTFITGYPTEVSPLARMCDDNKMVTDRFELFVAGRELANGFSELNDPEDQASRFHAQMQAKTKGDHEAMPYDEDYINALEYGMPPTAGEGIGIDRLVMLFTDAASIRDVILFPLLRPQKHAGSVES